MSRLSLFSSRIQRKKSRSWQVEQMRRKKSETSGWGRKDRCQVLNTAEESRKTPGHKDLLFIPQLFGKSGVYLENHTVCISSVAWTCYAFFQHSKLSSRHICHIPVAFRKGQVSLTGDFLSLQAWENYLVCLLLFWQNSFSSQGKYKHNHQEKNNWHDFISVVPQTQNSWSFCQKRPPKQKTIAFKSFPLVFGRQAKKREKGSPHQREPLFFSVYFAIFSKASCC